MKQKKILSNIFTYAMVFVFIALFNAVNVMAESAVNLRTAGDFVILSKAGISTTGTTAITGDIGVSPIDQTALTGFSETMDDSNEFSTSDYVTGKLYASDYADPTPAKMSTAISDMETAYTDAAGRDAGTGSFLNRGAGTLTDLTLYPGVYTWGSAVTIPTDLTLDCEGDSNAVFIFQISETLDISSDKQVILSGNCQTSNIFWQVAETTTLGTNSVFEGNILDATNIAILTGATLNGRAFAQTAVTLDANTLSLSPPVLTSITLTPASATVIVGQTRQLTVTNIDQYGNGIAIDINYTSNDTNIATVNASGMVTAISAGVAIITASSGAISDTSTITSSSVAPVLTTIILTPASATVIVGQTQQLSATGIDQYGNTMDAEINYTSNDTNIATVNDNGLVAAIVTGTTAIIASSEDVSDASTITVISAAVSTPAQSSGGGGSSSSRSRTEVTTFVKPEFSYPDCKSVNDCNEGEVCRGGGEFYFQCQVAQGSNVEPTEESRNNGNGPGTSANDGNLITGQAIGQNGDESSWGRKILNWFLDLFRKN